jgi:hypothetical protein
MVKAVSGGSVMWGRSAHFRYPDYWLIVIFGKNGQKGSSH